MSDEKFNKGLAFFKKIHGGLSAENTIAALSKISPQLCRFNMEWIFADLYESQEIDMQIREASHISALVAIGALPQLKNHIMSALKVGFSQEQVKQIILNNIIIVGFPNVVNALLTFQEVIEALPPGSKD